MYTLILLIRSLRIKGKWRQHYLDPVENKIGSLDELAKRFEDLGDFQLFKDSDYSCFMEFFSLLKIVRYLLRILKSS